MRCLWNIARIRWQYKAPNTDMLERCQSDSIEATLVKHQFRWVGHVIRMPDTPLPMRIFYGQLPGENERKKIRKRQGWSIRRVEKMQRGLSLQQRKRNRRNVLFKAILKNRYHVLYPYLPENQYQQRPHNKALIPKTTYLSDRHYIMRMLYKNCY